MMALGVINYLQTSGKTDMQIAAYDALAEAKEAIKAGTLAATIDQQAARQGYLGVEYAIKALRGEELPAETMVDVLLVTAENVES
jgi:ribose transport system substrate-binding protein